MADTLTLAGYETLTADNGKQALTITSSHAPELILLDVHMPHLNGHEVCRRLKANPETCHIPIIFISATRDRSEQVQGLNLGAEDFVTKPFQREELLVRVRTHIDLHRSHNQVTQQIAELAQTKKSLEVELLQHHESEQRTIALSQEAEQAYHATLNLMEDTVDARDQLEITNQELRHEIKERRRAEEEVSRLNIDLEQRVIQRTHQLEIANHELEAFSYSVSHDLRSPLRSIDGFSRILLEDYADKLDDEGMNSLNRIRAASQRMGKLIDDLLNLSRVSRSELVRKRVNLSSIADEIAQGLQEQDPARQVRWNITPDLNAIGDPGLLRTVLENLLSNAWKFTGKISDAVIEVGASPGEGPNAYFVRDNGAGFDMAYATKLFDAFQRLHSESDFPGTGIGLATAKRVIHRHGGQIRAESQVDAGATIHFTLPPPHLSS